MIKDFDFEKLRFSAQEKLDNLNLLSDQQLLAKYFFGNQITNENKSELGKWAKTEFNENIKYENMERSVDCWFRLGNKNNMGKAPYIDIRLFFNHENPRQSYVGVYILESDNSKNQSEMFFFSKDDFEKIKEFILSKKDILK